MRPYFPGDLMRVTRKPGTPREAPSPQHPNTKSPPAWGLEDQPPPPTVGATPGNRDEQVIGFLGAPHIFGGPHLQRQVPVPRLSPDPVVPGGLVTGALQAAPPGIPQAPLGSGWTPIMSSPALSILPARVSGVSADTQPESPRRGAFPNTGLAGDNGSSEVAPGQGGAKAGPRRGVFCLLLRGG